MDSRDFAVGILSTTAVVLLVGLVIVYSQPESALASGVTASAGNYTITVGSVASNDEELVYIIDASKSKMGIYRFDGNKRSIDMVDGVDLQAIAKASAAPVPGGAKPKRP